ncbi:MAG: RnfABCDGE type electron transport complex subunit A [Eubacteriales bacterium]|nr:RnfABCDGE type electron transport complex subunit A [Clostridiales bacterium]MDY5835556.1 RnfABCDGE type electron transport complex subunit A [Eubacteriales bacterium]
MKPLLMILFSVILVDNLVLSQFLGICSFLGLTKNLKSAMGMSLAVTFVMVVAAALTWPLYNLVLLPLGLEFLANLVFIIVIASTVQIIEAIIHKSVPSLYEAMGIFLPLITTNCAILGIMFVNIESSYSFPEALVNGLGAGLGYMLAMFLFTGVRQRMEDANPPKFLEGLPLTLIAAGLVSLSFFGFKGMVSNIFG